MPRIARSSPGGVIYHVLNRSARGQDLFEDPNDYAAFIRTLVDVHEQEPIRILGFCLMRNHWHLILWPTKDGQLSQFMQKLTVTHVRRWVEYRQRVGWGSIYQGRYKSFPVQTDAYLLTLLRYVERNPLRAKLVRRAEKWRWSSLGQLHAQPDERVPEVPLAKWPIVRPADWAKRVNQPQASSEEEAVVASLQRSRPLGSAEWTSAMEKKLRLPPLRPPGRPKGSGRNQVKPK